MLPKRKYAEIVAKQHYCRSADERDVQFEQRSHRRPGSTWGLPPDEAARPQNCLAEGLGLAHQTKAEQGHQHCRRHHTPREPFPPTGKKPHDPSPRTSFKATPYRNVTCWTIAARWPLWTPPGGGSLVAASLARICHVRIGVDPTGVAQRRINQSKTNMLPLAAAYSTANVKNRNEGG